MTDIMPINPVEVMSDTVIDEGLNRVPKTRTEKAQAFNEMLVEEIFLRDLFSTDNSIFKPEEDEEALFSPKTNSIYNGVLKKQVAKQIVAQKLVDNSLIQLD